MNGIAEGLLDLAQPIEKLVHLPGNPQRGNLAAITASYRKFGQVKPLVGVGNEDETITIIAGNHQLMAARELGWDKVAVLVVPMDNEEAISFALADNRVSELSHTDQTALYEMLETVYDPNFFEELGWDDFEMAALEESVEPPVESSVDLSKGYVAPTLVDDEEEGDLTFEGEEDDAKDVISRGATAGGDAGAKALVQYTILFEDEAQQRDWYAFLRWVKSQDEVKHLTTGGQIIWFIRNYQPQD